MAHGLMHHRPIMIGQALHGYADGHRQLAASTKIKPKDAKMVLALSDISGPGTLISDLGYLTGYPLVESGMYALARTWGAPEMPRPGCVWTHTLFIDFAELAQIEDFRELLALFRRPDGVSNPRTSYGRPLGMEGGEAVGGLDKDGASWVRNIVAGLYGKPRARIVSSRPKDIAVDDAVLAVWSQQWPRLRRQFRFCTFAASDRSTEGLAFDLQLLSEAGHGIRTRFTNAVDADSKVIPREKWIDEVVEDLAHPDVSGLRTFLRRSGADVPMGREAFGSLCRLHHAVRATPIDQAALAKAVWIVRSELPPRQARTAGALVAKAALDGLEDLDSDALDYLLSHLDLIEAEEIEVQAERIGRAAWRRDPGILFDPSREGPLGYIGRRTLGVLANDEIIEGIAKAPGTRETVLASRPDVTGEPSFWLLNPSPPSHILGTPGLSPATAEALVAAGRQDLASAAVTYLGATAVLRAVAKHWKHSTGDLDFGSWLSVAARDPSAVTQILTSGGLPCSLLAALARVTLPHTVPNDFGTDPWLTAYKSAPYVEGEEDRLILSGYLLTRALGHYSQNPAELVKLSFDQVYDAASRDKIPNDTWHMLEQKLPWSVLWYSWDRCVRLRSGVVNLFVDLDLPPDIFIAITSDVHVFGQLLDVIEGKGSRGRSYLKKVKHALNI